MKREHVDELRRALDLADRGDWHAAHAAVQALEHLDLPLASWLHASLHREEGDHGNARYWYGQAGRPVSRAPFAEERMEIRAALASPG